MSFHKMRNTLFLVANLYCANSDHVPTALCNAVRLSQTFPISEFNGMALGQQNSMQYYWKDLSA